MTNILPANVAVQLGENHGYRFEGDFVHLNADVMFFDADLTADKTWALQLWASDCGFAGAELRGIKVAELAIKPMVGTSAVAGYCSAMPPAGISDQVLGMALVAYTADGRSEVHDLAIYASRERFTQPRLQGKVICTLADSEAQLAIDAIVNPRTAGTLSGTLTLEVWALDVPYGGGSWAGIPVASLVLGVLAGGNEWFGSHFTVPAAMPGADVALTVMLREWTPTGYLTRDYRNITVAATKHATEVAVVPVVDALPVVEAAPEIKVIATIEAAPTEKNKDVTDLPKESVKQKSTKKAGKAPSTSKKISVNTASEEELMAVKGLPTRVARAIVAARPFAALDDVCRAKGIGAKLLAKLRDRLVL